MTSAFSGDQKRRIDYVDTNPVRKLAKWGVTSVTSNQRKWLIEQCFDMFSVLPLFRMSDLSVLEQLALFSFKFVRWFCSKLDMILFTPFSDHSKLKQTDIIFSCFVSLSLVNQRTFPRKNWPITGFPYVDHWLISVWLLGSLRSHNTQDCDGFYDCCDPWTLTFMWSHWWLWIWPTVMTWNI